MGQAENPDGDGHRRLRAPLLAALLLASAPALAQDAALPFFPVETVHSEGVRELETIISRAGWHLMGRAPGGYRIGTGRTEGMTGRVAAALQACDSRALEGHGALERTIPAADYAGKRVRVSARIKSNGTGTVDFYINAMGGGDRLLRHVALPQLSHGEWESKVLVADMPASAVAIDIGVALWGSSAATAWLDSASIEIVDGDVPAAGQVTVGGFQRDLEDKVRSCDGDLDGIRQ